MSKTLLNTLKNVVNGTISREYMNVTDSFNGVLKKNSDLAAMHNDCSDKADEIAEKLKAVVPEQYRGLINELVDNVAYSACAEGKMLFKEGVVLGATDLNYLGEIGTYLQFI